MAHLMPPSLPHAHGLHAGCNQQHATLPESNNTNTYDLPIKKTQIYRLDFVSFVSGK